MHLIFSRFFLFLSLTILLNTPASASECSAKDNEYAASWDNYYSPEGARAFGLKIQKLVKEKDLKGIFSLVNGELQSGPRKRSLVHKSFDEVFDAAWIDLVVSQEPACSPVGWRGFMLGHGLVWYNKTEAGWNILSLNGAAVERPAAKSAGWHFDERLLHPLCFSRPWLSGDNFEEFADAYNISDLQKLLRAPGLFMGSKISDYAPIRPSWCSSAEPCETISLVTELDRCKSDDFAFEERDGTVWITSSADGGNVEHQYNVLKELDAASCSKLAPDIGADCLESHLLRVGDYMGDSMGWNISFGIYGIFDLPEVGPSILPLLFFQNKNDATNYLDQD